MAVNEAWRITTAASRGILTQGYPAVNTTTPSKSPRLTACQCAAYRGTAEREIVAVYYQFGTYLTQTLNCSSLRGHAWESGICLCLSALPYVVIIRLWLQQAVRWWGFEKLDWENVSFSSSSSSFHVVYLAGCGKWWSPEC